LPNTTKDTNELDEKILPNKYLGKKYKITTLKNGLQFSGLIKFDFVKGCQEIKTAILVKVSILGPLCFGAWTYNREGL